MISRILLVAILSAFSFSVCFAEAFDSAESEQPIIKKRPPRKKAQPKTEAPASVVEEAEKADEPSVADDDKAIQKIDIVSSILLASNASGTGTAFFAEIKGKYFIVTNVHILSDDRKIEFATSRGIRIPTPTTGFVADSRDAYIMPIGELPEGAKALPMTENIFDDVEEGDELLICGNPLGGGVFRNAKGKLVGIGPDTVEFSNAIFKGNSGSPIYHMKSGKVIGIVARGQIIDSSDPFTSNARKMSNTPFTRATRFFGVRVDSANSWIPFTPQDLGVQHRELNDFIRRFNMIREFKNAEHKEIELAHKFPELQKICSKYWAVLTQTDNTPVRIYIRGKNVRETDPRQNLLKKAKAELVSEMSRLVMHEVARIKGRKFCGFLKSNQEALIRAYEPMMNYYDALSKM